MDMIASAISVTPTLPLRAGIGLKPQHYDAILDPETPSGRPDWVEVHPQNYFGVSDTLGAGPPHRWLSAIAEQFPISFHSVGLSLGSTEGLSAPDLDKLALLCDRYQPAMVSDHLSFSGNAHDRFADLLPIPYTQSALDHFVDQVNRVQHRLARKMLIENPSCYLAYTQSEMSEAEFLGQLIDRTGCGLLLDINNIVVSTGNLGGAAEDYLAAIDPEWVGEIHLAGHATERHESGPLYIDNHGSAVGDRVWQLYADFMERAGAKPTLIEWDTDVPGFDILMIEASKANAIIDEKCHALA